MSKFSSFFPSPTAPTSQNGGAPTHAGSTPSAPASAGRPQPSSSKTAGKPRSKGQIVPWPFPPKPPHDDRDPSDTRSRRWLTGLAALVLALAAFGLGLVVASPGTSNSHPLVFGGKVQQLTPFTPAAQTRAAQGKPVTPSGHRLTALAALPGAGKASARALLVRNGALARIVFSANVPTSGFAIYLTGGIGKGRHSGDILLALHRRGASLGATPYPLAGLAKYRWLTVFETGTHKTPAHPILRISLTTLGLKDGVPLNAPTATRSKHR